LWVLLAVVGTTFTLVGPATYITSRMAVRRTAAEAINLPDA
jgi:hypothetical protein